MTSVPKATSPRACTHPAPLLWATSHQPAEDRHRDPDRSQRTRPAGPAGSGGSWSRRGRRPENVAHDVSGRPVGVVALVGNEAVGQAADRDRLHVVRGNEIPGRTGRRGPGRDLISQMAARGLAPSRTPGADRVARHSWTAYWATAGLTSTDSVAA